ncbi:hypothetical protein ERO13_D08G141950v2 [Gossypium hirsutum]|nr:hypothetical protein ERO13_D08G141950v2 [Gossypium hirsutum]
MPTLRSRRRWQPSDDFDEKKVRSGMRLVQGLRLRRECGKLPRVSLVLETLGLHLFCFDLGPCKPVYNFGPFTRAKIGYYNCPSLLVIV